MREMIGLLGGSFNPIHYGHLSMAEAAQKELGLDRVFIIPCGDPPHKRALELAGKLDRLRMAELAVNGRFEVSRTEIDRPGKTYTVDTVTALKSQYPDAEFVLIIGADTELELHAWHDAPRLYTLCRFAVFERKGFPISDIPEVRAIPMKTSVPDISATEIRRRIHLGMSLEELTPWAVEAYIGLHRLYEPPKRVSRTGILKRMKRDLPPDRFRHVLGVEATMGFLAERWGYNEERAALTGLLHDCAKGMKLEEMQSYVAALGVQVDAMRMTSKALLHAPASAAMARAAYGVTDPEILQAVWYHNTGNSRMGKLDKLLFIADMIEPSRKPYPWMDGLKALATTDLDKAVLEVTRIKIEHINQCGKPAHPETAAVYAALEINRNEEEMQ